jgi:hypothetical protein
VENIHSLFSALRADFDSKDRLAVQHACHFGGGSPSDRLRSVSFDGGVQVDLTLRLNVLAVCAAIVFVGAILFGAF